VPAFTDVFDETGLDLPRTGLVAGGTCAGDTPSSVAVADRGVAAAKELPGVLSCRRGRKVLVKRLVVSFLWRLEAIMTGAPSGAQTDPHPKCAGAGGL
jgi:hypothetical protein